MKNIILIFLSSYLFISSCSSGMSPEEAAEFYAPVIHERMTPIREKTAPKKSDVPFPAYPNSTMLRWGDTMEEGKTFMTLSLVTSDSQDQVKEFFIEELEDWTFDNSLNTFLKDSKAGFMKTNMVSISDFQPKLHPYDLKFLKKPRTMIEIIIEKVDDQ